MSVLDCRDLSFEYEGRPVLSHVNFSLEKGSYLGIIGENGSGKSTLVKGILGLQKQAAGEIRLHLPDAQDGLPAAAADHEKGFSCQCVGGRIVRQAESAFFSL